MAKTKTINVIRDEEHVISEANGRASREQVLLDSSLADTAYAGTVLGKVTGGAGAAAFGAWASGTGAAPGNSTFSAITVDAGAPRGNYRIEWTDATHFRVLKPDQTLDGVGTTAVAYNGSINMTITAGGTPMVEDDYGYVAVTDAVAPSGRYKPLNLAATDGTQVAAVILAPTEKPTDPATHIRTSVHARQCEVNGNKIFWPTGITDDQKAAAEAQLATAGILVRY